MLRGTASTAVRRLRFPRRAASGLLAIVVGLAAGGVVGLGVVTADSTSRPVTRAVLGDSRASLVSPDATADAPSGTERAIAPSAASIVALTGSGRLARAALTAGDIPPAAWAAYLRAAAVMAQAAPRCELDWTVLAAIGLAESDHGRDLPPSGAAAGPAAPDSDAGQLDGDPHRDVPVGPMRLLPSTWQVIGVDGDGDGVRSPADIDDAALAVGVALCAGDARLGTEDGLRAALLRFAPSPAYVDLILRLARAYAEGAFGTPTSIDVTAVAHPVVTDTRTTLARKSLARRVEAAQAAAAESVGVGTSAAAQLLATATASTAPGAPVAGGASLSLTDPNAPGTASLAPVASPVAGAVVGPVAGTAPDPTSPASPSGDPSGGTTTADPSTGSPSAGPTSDPPASDPPASDPPASDPPASDPPASDPPASDPAASDPPASDPPASDPPASDPPASEPPASDPADPGSGSGSGSDPAGAPQECPTPSADPSAAPSAGSTADPTPTDSPTPCPDPTSGASAPSDPPAGSPAAEQTAP